MGKNEKLMRIGELVERTGLTARTIRYYEEIGLFEPNGRTEGEFRLYSSEDLNRLQHIIQMKELLGFSLQEIKEFLDMERRFETLKGSYNDTLSVAERVQILHEAEETTWQQIRIIRQKIQSLNELLRKREELLKRIAERLHDLQNE
jgi:DNA-binding transcriptional MerR regulator